MKSYGITPKQLHLKNTVEIFINEHKYSPTISELADLTKSHKSVIHGILERLKRKGHIDWLPKMQRSITIIDDDHPKS
jgi:SOS-response transcriptional repressor LexA